MPAQLAGAIEYDDSISAELLDPLPNECFEYNTKPSDGEAPVLRLWGMWNTLHCRNFQVHSDLEW